MNVTDVPEQMVELLVIMLTLGTCIGVTVITIQFDVAVGTVLHKAELVTKHVKVSLFETDAVTKVDEFVRMETLFLNH